MKLAMDNAIADYSAISIRAVENFVVANNSFAIPNAEYAALQQFNDAGTRLFEGNTCVVEGSKTSVSCKVE